MKGSVLGAAPHLEARGIGYRCPYCDQWLFRFVDFDLFPGDIAVLRGSDKKTRQAFSRVLSGNLGPTEGRVCCDGRSISTFDRLPVRLVAGISAMERINGSDPSGIFARYLIIDEDSSPMTGIDNVSLYNIVRREMHNRNVGVLASGSGPSSFLGVCNRVLDFGVMNRFARGSSPKIRFRLS